MSQQATTGFVYGMTGPDPAPQRRTGFVRPAPNRPAAPKSGTLLCDDGDGHMMCLRPRRALARSATSWPRRC